VNAGPTIRGDQKEANKYITLSAILPPGKAPAKPRENKRYLNLLDIANITANERAEVAEAGGADMGDVEKALEQAILKEWIAPSAQAVPPSQRRATMEIVILRDGTIADSSIKTASGSSLFNASIRKAADRLKKIPVTLPSNFPKERYELRVNFQIE
jgi:outer membrane biosynthesis protein TonB